MTYFNDPHIPRFEHPDYFDAEIVHCELCTEPYEADEHCQNEHCHCQDCGEALPETEDGNDVGHCENCCECDACYDAEEKAQAIFESTGEWIKKVITGEKVFTILPR